MIKVKIDRNADGSIRSFAVSGHALYADPGKDIVCAGVSSVTVGTVNAIEALTGVVLISRMKDGFLRAAVPELDPEDKSDQVQLLLEAMVVMLNSIENAYGEFITVSDGNTIHSRRR
ncbi:MAG: ribosomal protein [Paenibacillaceae bacterium]|jgi:uncharacterized protein YsxB (DUF464 family)|nr:ribosomal protein [Paenibacillaceae bacterium]